MRLFAIKTGQVAYCALAIAMVIGAIFTRLLAPGLSTTFGIDSERVLDLQIACGFVVTGALWLGLYGIRDDRFSGPDADSVVEPARPTVLSAVDRTGKVQPPIQAPISARRLATALPSREYLLGIMGDDIGKACGETMLAALELRDYDRLCAFDPAAAAMALKSFSAKLATVVGDRHSVAHVDRGTFALWFGGSDCESAQSELSAICYALRSEISTPELSLVPEVAARACFYPVDGIDPEALLARTLITGRDAGDEASLFEGAVRVADSGHARERYSLEQDLRRAVERQELELEFQPIVDLTDGSIAGAESLIRWNHPSLGRISPARFVPILEEMRLIDEVGMWALNTACRAAREWRDQGLSDLTVAVNLSAQQLDNPLLDQAIERTLQRHALPAESLVLELTETAAMQDAARTLSLFAQFKALGVRLSLDDFGTGYSSLKYLLKLPFDKLKIDREFVVNVHRESGSQAICRSLCELAKGLGIGLIAEGAELPEEVAMLSQIGCRFIQGFYFSPPISSDAFAALAGSRSTIGLLGAALSTSRIADIGEEIAA